MKKYLLAVTMLLVSHTVLQAIGVGQEENEKQDKTMCEIDTIKKSHGLWDAATKTCKEAENGVKCINQNFENIEGTFYKSDGSCLPDGAACILGKKTVTENQGPVTIYFEREEYGLWDGKNKKCNPAEVGTRCTPHWLGRTDIQGTFNGNGCQVDGLRCVNDVLGIWDDNNKKCKEATNGTSCKTYRLTKGTWYKEKGQEMDPGICLEKDEICHIKNEIVSQTVQKDGSTETTFKPVNGIWNGAQCLPAKPGG